MAIITPKLTITSNSSDYAVATEQGPISVAMSLITSTPVTCVGVESGILTVNTADNATGWLFDGSLGEDADNGVMGVDGSYIFLKNMTATTSANLILVGVVADVTETVTAMEADESAARLFSLKPQEFAWFPFDHTMNIMVDTDTDGTKLEWFRFDRTRAGSITP